jgi:murein DD-endopeptidase MepM/ murein hydrolase activator NlpD
LVVKPNKWMFLGAALILVIGILAWFFLTVGEFGKPRIDLDQDVSLVGRQKVLGITFRDSGSGLRKAAVTLTQGARTQVVAALDFPQRGVHEKTLSVPLDPWQWKLQEGPATLTVTATDHSLWKNTVTLEKPITVDILPPQILLTASMNHINPGGTCLVAYRVSKPVIMSGVMVDQRFFPSFPADSSGKPSYVVYFALPIGAVSAPPRIRVVARDAAGNEGTVGLPALILEKKFRSDEMSLGDAFFQQKMPEFQAAIPELRGKTPVETFVYVNSKLREENAKTIFSVCQRSVPKQLWEGTFLRMKDAAPMALFGDHRTYRYNGQTLGESTHMGVDLASTAHAPIEAANNGIVAFAGPLGIYGNAVILDHGQGLFSLYGHMSGLQVKNGQEVKKGAVIGTSGMTGLAGGDHLHFSILVAGEFVNPTEWWDPHWIKDNVTAKLAEAP